MRQSSTGPLSSPHQDNPDQQEDSQPKRQRPENGVHNTAPIPGAPLRGEDVLVLVETGDHPGIRPRSLHPGLMRYQGNTPSELDESTGGRKRVPASGTGEEALRRHAAVRCKMLATIGRVGVVNVV